jgi:hypothetical protein
MVPKYFVVGPPILVTRKNKTIELKKEYLCDLFHSIYSKYLNRLNDNQDKNQVTFSICSKQLQVKYGKSYPFYLKHLVDAGFIAISRKHKKDENCTIYRFRQGVVEKSELILYKNEDNKIIVSFKETLKTNVESKIYPKKLVNTINKNLQSITIKKQEAIDYLNSQYNENERNNEKYIRNYISILNIVDKHSYLKIDDYGRIHTFFTVLKKEIRKQFLLIDGEPIKEKDISNSQALFFLHLMSKNLDDKINKSELIKFKDDVFGNKLYTRLGTFYGLIREDAKEIFYRLLFGGANANDKAFNTFYPTIRKFMRRSKVGNYKRMAHKLQKAESEFIFKKICVELKKEKIKFFTIHDSICVKVSDFTLLESIFNNRLNNLKQEIINNIQSYYRV